jgi:xanthine/uracil permease
VKRPLTAALLLGLVNAAVAVLALALVEVATPDEFGWFAMRRSRRRRAGPRFPWHYVVAPLSLLVANVVVVRAYLGRALRLP